MMTNIQKPISILFFVLTIIALNSQVFATFSYSPSEAPSSLSYKDLIAETCDHAVYRDLCEKTIRADEDSQQADVTGLASIAIKVAMMKGTEIYNQISKMLNGRDPLSLQSLTDCSDNYMDAVDQLEDSLAAIDTKGFNDVSTWVQAAITAVEQCEKGFKVEVGHFSLLSDKNTAFNQLCSNALALANLLAESKF